MTNYYGTKNNNDILASNEDAESLAVEEAELNEALLRHPEPDKNNTYIEAQKHTDHWSQ